MADYIYKDGELYHAHKYIKKKKVNGKWCYYYDIKDALGFDERDAAGDAVRNYNRAKENLKGYGDLESNLSQTKWYSAKKHARLKSETEAAGKKANTAVNKYYKTPLGKLDRMDDKIDIIRKKVSKWLKRLSNKVAPEKESLTKYGTRK